MNQSNHTLWNISEEMIELENLINQLQDSEELSEEEKEVKINQLFSEWLTADTDFEEKAEKVAHYIKYLEAITEARKAEAKRIRVLASMSEKQGDKLRKYLIREMQRVNKTKIEGVTCKLSMRKKQPTICLKVEPEELPDEFKRVKIEPNLTEIRKALKSQKDLDWAFLSDDEDYSLTIK
ncbi:siphovirus Gp157 family protein [Crocosphaera sp.]|uniref:siphovirus Gp157 family protein n=1 Tax=Crocosphaera sp. TaxID=2729996 RepID=UPI003F26E464|nr:siphovirus Gp157 family protein [Crocosphaera sp.]